MKYFSAFASLFLLITCSKDTPTTSAYFPPATSSDWATTTPASLGWDETKIPDLMSFLQTNNTRAFVVLKNGKIVIEQYFGTQINNANAFDQSSVWYWASAGKTLTSALVGIAYGQGKVNLDAKTSDYLGTGWTSLTTDQENKITVRNQLTMTTGLDDYSDPGSTGDKDCTDKACLIYKADAGTRWAYHNAPYTLLDGVIAAGTGQTLINFFNSQIGTKTGMDGTYIKSGYNNVFYSTPRSMARYGLLLLNEGAWNGTQIIPKDYFQLMKNTSQNMNLSYGYLTWLNGKASFMTPNSQTVYTSELTTSAPPDMFAAMGKNGQIINVVPALGLVVVRMGDAPDNNLVPFVFQNDMWTLLTSVIK